MRKIARWTIGKTNSLGEECLRQSVRRFKILYPEFEIIVCCNNLADNQRLGLNNLNVEIYDQKSNELDYPLVDVNSPFGWKGSMPGWGWKLLPPRLSINSHELWIDNDVIVRERIPSIDKWLESNRSLVSLAHQRAYGVFDQEVPGNTPYCAGFFGLPPGFDFNSRILHHCKKLNGRPLGYYDEQGVTVSCLLEADPIVIPETELSVVKILKKPYSNALHFIGLNRTNDHKPWSDYKCYTLM
jgi:hypothetical protein